MPYAAITGWGFAVPDRVVTNADLERMVDTSDEWIVSRTGIRERRIVSQTDSTTSLAALAAARAVEKAGLSPMDIELIVTATCTADDFLVSQAALVQAAIGSKAAAFDVGSACAGFVTALDVATQFVRSGSYKRVLVVGADTLSRYIDFTDRSTCVLFGDGAGAIVLEATEEERGLLASVMGADGSGSEHLFVPGTARFAPESADLFPDARPHVQMNGQAVYKFAVNVMNEASVEAIAKAGMDLDDIDMLIPHQANIRIIEAAAKRLNLPMDRVWVNLDRYGNTTAATIPIAISEAADAGKLKEGANVVVVAFGAGLAWASGVLRWGVAGTRNAAQ
ncbi:MAG: ketoacyl-ACP synthase III [Thermomicrobiales bacterium]|nr:ketoacyl-ACP synthase III [Thermomicrobiales bacterium]